MLGPLFRLLHSPQSLPDNYVDTLTRVWEVLPHRTTWRIQAPTDTIASDASPFGIGMATRSGNLAILMAPASDIYVREAKALALAAFVCHSNAILLCDNAAVVHAVTRGHGRTLPWQLATAISIIFVIKSLWARWIPTHANPADAPSRINRT